MSQVCLRNQQAVRAKKENNWIKESETNGVHTSQVHESESLSNEEDSTGISENVGMAAETGGSTVHPLASPSSSPRVSTS